MAFATSFAVLTSATLVALAGTLLAFGWRRPDFRALSATLLLGAAGRLQVPATALDSPAWEQAVAAGAAVCTLLASVTLLSFVLSWIDLPEAVRRRHVFVALAAVAVWAGLRVVAMPDGFGFLRGSLSSLIIAVVGLWTIRNLAQEGIFSRPAVQALFPAIWVLTLPSIAMGARQAVHATYTLVEGAGVTVFTRETVGVASLVHLTILLVGSGWALRQPIGRLARGITVAILVLQLAFKVVEIPYYLEPRFSTVSPYADLVRVEVTLRWLLFGILVTAAILRYRLLPVVGTAWRVSSRIAVAAMFAGVALGAMHASRLAGWQTPDAFQVAVVSVALLVSQGARNAVDRTGRFLFRPANVLWQPLAIGQRLDGRWQVTGLLGRGRVGHTFAAMDTTLDREVAIKELGSSEAAILEARAAAKCRHPRIVQVHDVITVQDATYIVSELVPGSSLGERLGRNEDLSADAPAIVADLLEGLAEIHRNGMVHGDLSTSNVLLGRDGVKIADFGAARSNATVSRELGTAGFIAPEVLGGGPSSPRADVFAVGRIARELRGDWPQSHEGVIARALATAPARRHPDAGAMLEAWKDALGAEGPPRRPAGAAPTAVPRR